MCLDNDNIPNTKCTDLRPIYSTVQELLKAVESWHHADLLQDAVKVKEERLRKFYELEKKFN